MTEKNLLQAVKKEVTDLSKKNKEVYAQFLNNYTAIENLTKQASEMSVRSVAFGRKANATKKKMRMKFYKYVVYLIAFIIALFIIAGIASSGR